MPKLQLQPYSDKELDDLSSDPDILLKIEKLMKFFQNHEIEYNKFKNKKAYPNIEYQNIPPSYNIEKWLNAVRSIYAAEKNGQNRVQSIRKFTDGWPIPEIFNFLNWIKYYEGNNQFKYKAGSNDVGNAMTYKTAQLWYENPNLGPGYFLQVKKDEPTPDAPKVDLHAINDDVTRKQTIERQRNKIIGRLDSAEKLLRSPDGHIFSGKEFEYLLDAIYKLKTQIQMVNKQSSSTRLYEDMIYRQGNILNNQGFGKAANILYSLAQSPGQSGESAKGNANIETNLPPATPPNDPSGAGHPGLPSGGAGTPAGPDGNSTFPQSEPNNPPKGIADFISGLEKGNFSPSDSQEAKDEVDASEVDDELEVIDHDDEIVVEAQIAPPTNSPKAIDEPMTSSPAPAPLDPSPVRPPSLEDKVEPIANPDKSISPDSEEDLEVTENDPAPGSIQTSEFSAKVDNMFANVSITDIVNELEELSKIFKVREIPRRISKVDMMLDGKGLASYFPSLSESLGKSIESNNYISTRIEEILSKLRGALPSDNQIDLKGEDQTEDPSIVGLKSKLKSDEDKEKTRKEMRKNKENIELDNKQPEVEIDEDLAPTPTLPQPTAKAPTTIK